MVIIIEGAIVKMDRSENLKKESLLVELKVDCDETHNPIAIIDLPLGSLADASIGDPVRITVKTID